MKEAEAIAFRKPDGMWWLSDKVTGITSDSRRVSPGSVFVAVKGFLQDGHQFIDDALAHGAILIVAEEAVECSVPVLPVSDSRIALAELSCSFYEDPSRHLMLIGVTGTNGKTTVTYLMDALLRRSGLKTGMIGTVENRILDETFRASLTTPDPVELQSLLRWMVDRGVQAATMEVSSHALELHRVAACEFDIAIYTNLGRDHYDFHKDLSSYRAAKAKLFLGLGKNSKKNMLKLAAINKDDSQASYFAQAASVPVVFYSTLDPTAYVYAENIRPNGWGSLFTLKAYGIETEIHLAIPGVFNVENALAVTAVGLKLGIDLKVIKDVLENPPTVPGRYERIDLGQDFTVMVDYAHNPEGLQNILRAAKRATSGRLISIFGARGRRDQGKRPIMGQVASDLADRIVLTTDSPYGEDPLQIAQDILRGVPEAKHSSVDFVLNRQEAIMHAVRMAQPGDTIVITGRGHETTQMIGEDEVLFSDRQGVRTALQRRLNQDYGSGE